MDVDVQDLRNKEQKGLRSNNLEDQEVNTRIQVN